jgi:phosphatidylglycerophosphate synthase
LTKLITTDDATNHKGPIIVVRGDAVLDQPLIGILPKRPNFVLLSSDGRKDVVAGNVRAQDFPKIVAAIESGASSAMSGILARSPDELGVSFWKALRKKETPYALLLNQETAAAIAWRMFMGTYKGATDVVTKFLWPAPAFHVTQFLADRGVTPNMVTVLAAAMTVAAFFLFWSGSYTLGLICAWFMTFLDTVDGKLARTTLTTSKWGDIFDHGIDLVHPPFWYAAWALGLFAWGLALSPSAFIWVIATIFAGYVLQRVMEGIAIKWLGLEIHIWRKLDTQFRLITARRNPNLILLTLSLLVGRPDWGIVAVALWTGICLVLHAIQLVQAFSAKRSGDGLLASWMSKP